MYNTFPERCVPGVVLGVGLKLVVSRICSQSVFEVGLSGTLLQTVENYKCCYLVENAKLQIVYIFNFTNLIGKGGAFHGLLFTYVSDKLVPDFRIIQRTLKDLMNIQLQSHHITALSYFPTSGKLSQI